MQRTEVANNYLQNEVTMVTAVLGMVSTNPSTSGGPKSPAGCISHDV